MTDGDRYEDGIDRESLDRAERAVQDDSLVDDDIYWRDSEAGPLTDDFEGVDARFEDIALEEMRRRRNRWTVPLAAFVAVALVVTWVLSRW